VGRLDREVLVRDQVKFHESMRARLPRPQVVKTPHGSVGRAQVLLDPGSLRGREAGVEQVAVQTLRLVSKRRARSSGRLRSAAIGSSQRQIRARKESLSGKDQTQAHHDAGRGVESVRRCQASAWRAIEFVSLPTLNSLRDTIMFNDGRDEHHSHAQPAASIGSAGARSLWPPRR